MVQEGYISGVFQSPLQRGLTSTDTGPRTSASSVGGRESFAYEEFIAVESSARKQRSAEHRLFVEAVGVPVNRVKRLRQQEIRESFALMDSEGETQVESHERTRNGRTAMADSKHKAASPGHNVDPLDDAHNQIACPLIYTADAQTAKEHGLLLFQVSGNHIWNPMCLSLEWSQYHWIAESYFASPWSEKHSHELTKRFNKHI